jgi:hypothetical protein
MMNEWERKELELQRKENAWYDKLHPLMKMVDNPLIYFGLLFAGCVIGGGIGLLIGKFL